MNLILPAPLEEEVVVAAQIWEEEVPCYCFG